VARDNYKFNPKENYFKICISFLYSNLRSENFGKIHGGENHLIFAGGGGGWSSGKYVGTTRLRAAGSSPALPAMWVFWRLIWPTESLDRDLILVCRFSFISSRECIPVAAQTCSCLLISFPDVNQS
jgi:hypothetical protein